MKSLLSKFKNKSDSLKIISKPNRIRILLMLQHKAMCLCEITVIFGLTTATLSKQLSILSKDGFLVDEKDGKNDTIYNEIIDFLTKLYSNQEIITRDAKITKIVDRNK